MTKKQRIKIPKENKVRAELQKEIMSCCPFCDNEDVGHFEIHHIDESPENNDNSNLMLLCPICHSKITKGDINQTDVFKKKIELLTNPKNKKTSTEKSVNFNDKVENAVVGDNNKIIINQQKKKIIEKYPEGCIGHDVGKRNYIDYLKTRYHDYKEYEVGKENMKYGIFPAELKKVFKIGQANTIYNLQIGRFEELVSYIQNKINKTMLAKMKGKNHKNYSTFEDYEKNNC